MYILYNIPMIAWCVYTILSFLARCSARLRVWTSHRAWNPRGVCKTTQSWVKRRRDGPEGFYWSVCVVAALYSLFSHRHYSSGGSFKGVVRSSSSGVGSDTKKKNNLFSVFINYPDDNDDVAEWSIESRALNIFFRLRLLG